MLFASFIIFYAVLQIGAFVAAFFAISNARTPQGAVAWAVFLITVPLLALPFFALFGRSKFEGYVIARRENRSVIAGLRHHGREHAPQCELSPMQQAMQTLAGMPLVGGNATKLLVNGQATFDAIFEAIEKAQTYVLVQYYSICDDTIGARFQEALIAAVQRGVKVRLLFDAVGSSALPEAYIQKLRDAGVIVVNIHALQGPTTRFQINFRNHRKTVVVDGRIGFAGGLNVSDPYACIGKTKWRDTHCQLTGPMVAQLQLIYVEDWLWASNETLLEELNWDTGIEEPGHCGLIMPTGPADEMETGSLFFCAAINAAKSRVWIASPYFVPGDDIMTALKLAALRGVEVRILTPHISDHLIVRLSALPYFDTLMDAGVEVWRYKPAFMHQKVMLVDDDFTSIGSANLDNRSCRLNFELNVLFFEETVAAEVEAMLKQDFVQSYRMDSRLQDRKALERYGAPFARLFSPLL